MGRELALRARLRAVHHAPHTAVLIPARDEGPRIAGTVADVRRVLPTARVLVVDGGSRDDTGRQARAAGADVIGQQGTGYAGALLAGYSSILSSPAQHIVQLDGDGQHPAGAAPALLAALGPRHHLAIASRHGTSSRGGLRRRAGNHLLAELVRLLTGTHLRDVTSGFWAFDRYALRLLSQHLPRDCADANVRVLALRLGLDPVEVQVPMQARSAGMSMHDGWQGVANFATSVHRTVQAARLPVSQLELPQDRRGT